MNMLQKQFISRLTVDRLARLITDVYYETAGSDLHRQAIYEQAAALGLARDNGAALAEELLLRCRITAI